MKNNLFKKILALFLVGTVLAGVGCKDYDDDIDAINKKLDNLETVTIAELQDQIKGIEGTVKSLESLSTQVEALEKKLDGTGNLSKQLQELESRLKAYADSGDQSTLRTAENKFALEGALNSLERELTALIDKKLDKDNALDLATVKGEIESQIEALKKDATWLGAEIDQYLTQKDYAGTVSQKASADILGEIQKEGSAYQEAIKTLITGATSGKISKNDLDEELAAYLAKVDALLERVAILEKRIQSLVYVPEYADGKIVFTGAQYFKWDDADAAPFMLREGGSQLATLTFRVSPAALVKDIANKEVLSMVTEEVKTRAAVQTGFAIDEVIVSDAAKGEFKVTVSTAYDYAEGAKENKTQMVALHVDGTKISVAEGQKPYDIDFTSEFIATEEQNSTPDVGANIVLAYDKNAAKAGQEGYEPDYAAYTAMSSELKYTATEPQALLPGYEVMYKDGENFITLKAAAEKYAWTADIEALMKVTGAISVDPEQNASSYELKDRMLTIKTPAAGLIGNTVTAKFLFALVNGDNIRTIQKDATHTVDILTDGPEFKAEKSSLTWSFAVATALDGTKNVYAAEAVQLTNSTLSAVEYNKLKAMSPACTIENDKGITAAIELTGTANRDTDPQYVKVTLTGDLSASAEYEVKAVYQMPEGNEITIVCPVSVTGAPTAKEIAVEPVSIAYDGTKFTGYQAVENYCDLIWAQLTSAEQAQYGDQQTFTTMVQDLAAPSTAALPRLRVGQSGANKAHLFVDFDAATQPAEAYDLACEIKAAWGVIANFKATVTMTVPELAVTYDARYNNGKPAVITTYSDQTGLALKDLKLGELVYYQGDVANVKVVFDFDEATKAKMTDDNKAEISAANELSWGQWNRLSLGITAQLMYGEVKIGDPIAFTPSITDPIAKGAIDAKPTTLKVSKDNDDPLNLHSILTLNDLNKNNVFENTSVRADINTFLGGTVSFGDMKTSGNISNLDYNAADGTLIVQKSDFILPNPITVEIPVTFNYLYADEFDNLPRTGIIKITISQK